MTWDEWTGIVLWLNASYPDQKVEPVTAKVWYEDLEIEDTATVAVALRRCRRMSGFRPQLATILEVCREVRAERALIPPDPSEAIRHCGGCAKSPVVGWIPTGENGLEVWYPCPTCKAEQYGIWELRVKVGRVW